MGCTSKVILIIKIERFGSGMLESTSAGRNRESCSIMAHVIDNKVFPRFKNSHFRNKAKCLTFFVKMSFICFENKNTFLYQ